MFLVTKPVMTAGDGGCRYESGEMIEGGNGKAVGCAFVVSLLEKHCSFILNVSFEEGAPLFMLVKSTATFLPAIDRAPAIIVALCKT